ncbi:DUF1405 domain-containing protein [Haloferax volcanii]|uniref:DUF1405 domain-containing protein n=1 Tax=Haloferax volcanii TaxID=2246 RepID=A0A6C0UY61_HALVO|nr:MULTISPECIES: DUF1405 domain-containing protein [Haloferax]ELK54537.1 hypothetical protein D320_09467 [Haloferax sp. BAB-2207]QIB79523.1 DUF1405 domain-containing protein [Haloferax alexandrinus]WEL26377.1 Uncharacterized membrane protein, DUF1405 family [Haloferax lucentense]
MGLRDFDLDAAVDDWTEYYLGNGPSLVVFLVLNAAAFLVGVSFYVHSDPALSDLPTFLYPLFGDSPAALALMTLSAATLLPNLGRRVADAPVNRPLAYLHTLAFVWLVKYGVWTVVALNLRPDLYVGFSGAALWDYWGIMLTHAGFLALALVVPRYGATTKGALGFALTLALVNDVFDYGLGYYPPLKYEAGALLAGITVALSFLAVFLASRAFDRLPDATGAARERPASHNR